MKTIASKMYEGMFLVDTALAAADWEGVNETIKGILEKAGAEIISMKKWDERKLAYVIDGKSRGTYILVFFRVDGPRIREIERSVQLSERIMRVLILNIDEMGQEYMEKATPAMAAQQHGPVDSKVPEDTQDETEDEIEEAPDITELDVSEEEQ